MGTPGQAKDIPCAWVESVTDWSAALRAGGAPVTTLGTRLAHVRRLARGMGSASSPWTVSADELVQWAGRQDWAVETRRSFRSSALAFYRWGVASGRTTENPAEALPRVKPADPAARPAPERVYAAALAAADSRERTMLRLAAECGMRRGEVAIAHTRDLVEDLEGWSLVVHGKGSKDRIIPLPDTLARELRAMPDGFLFPGSDGGHLSPRWVGRLVGRLLPGEHTMHALRHRFGTRAYLVNRDVLVVQELLGHGSPVTTRRYVRIPRESLRATVEAVQRAAA